MTLDFTEIGQSIDNRDMVVLLNIASNMIQGRVMRGQGSESIPGLGFQLNRLGLRLLVLNSITTGESLTWLDTQTALHGLLAFMDEPPPLPGFKEAHFLIQRGQRGTLGRGILERGPPRSKRQAWKSTSK